MKRLWMGLALLLACANAGATPAGDDAVQPAAQVVPASSERESRLAESGEDRACPTSYEVRTYFWIEPKTGREYKILNFYCPGLDEA